MNTSDEARADIRAKTFYRDGQNASILQSNEINKKREYNIKIMEIEHWAINFYRKRFLQGKSQKKLGNDMMK